MNDAKMLKALESVCMGKRNQERLRCIFVKDGTAYASDDYLLVAVQDAFTEPHGHDGLETVECVNGIWKFKPLDKGVYPMPGFEECFSSHMNAKIANAPVLFAPNFITKALRVFTAMDVKPDIRISEHMSMIMMASSTGYLVRVVLMGIR